MPKLKTNTDQLVKIAVLGEIADPPINLASPYRISADGEPLLFPATGGITYNKRIGDSAIDLWGDHIEPAVTLKHASSDRTSSFSGGLNVLACVGNRAKVVSGEAKGEWGRVTGTHGGVEHVMVDFTPEQMDLMVIGDKVQIISFGQGLKLVDFPDIHLFNLDPVLLDVMNMTGSIKKGTVKVPVTHTIPAAVMGSGLGKNHVYAGDYDIQMFDEDTVNRHNMNSLRFGDIVAITDADHTFGRSYLQKAVSIGVIVHSRSVLAGHGPGVATLMCARNGKIEPVIDANANLKYYFDQLGDLGN